MSMYRLKNLRSRAATAENPRAEPGAGGKANNGRKGSPFISPMKAGATHVLLDAQGPGMIRHVWCTLPPGRPDLLRNQILRMFWDGQSHPSVEVPLGDFFGVAHGRQCELTSELVSMQAGKGFNCWIPMPFRHGAKITLENDTAEDISLIAYQIDFTLDDVIEEDAGYFHAQFRRMNPCPLFQDYTILDGVRGSGVYLGTVLGIRSLFREHWWGEGEVKFYLDDDTDYPTICGTGAEDYMGSAWGLERVVTPYQGAPLVDRQLQLYSLYRFHVKDPIYFRSNLTVTIQQIGGGDAGPAKEHFGADYVAYPAVGAEPDSEARYVERSDDWSSVAYWYQSLPTVPFPALPKRAARSADLPTG